MRGDEIDDELDSPIPEGVEIRFSATPISSEVVVPLPPIWTVGEGTMGYFDEFGSRKYETVRPEDLDTCVFNVNTHYMEPGVPLEAKALPDGLYGKEFLKLNPLDIQEMLMFQRKYGMIYGVRDFKTIGTEGKSRLRPVPFEPLFSGFNEGYLKEQLAGIKASTALYDKLATEGIKTDRDLEMQGGVTFHEAITAVSDAQWAIRACTRAMGDDLPVMTKREGFEAVKAAEYVSSVLSRVFPSISLVVGKPQKKTCDLITAILAQLAQGLLSNETYRVCNNPECKRLFTPREMNRRKDTRYCSSECQERAKRLRYEARSREPRDKR